MNRVQKLLTTCLILLEQKAKICCKFFTCSEVKPHTYITHSFLLSSWERIIMSFVVKLVTSHLLFVRVYYILEYYSKSLRGKFLLLMYSSFLRYILRHGKLPSDKKMSFFILEQMLRFLLLHMKFQYTKKIYAEIHQNR